MSPDLGVSVRSILEFARNRGLLAAQQVHPGSAELITGVHADVAAQAGSISWLSKRVAEQEPSRISEFAGTLLLVPSGVAPVYQKERHIVPCTNPKLAFSVVVNHFFSEMLVTRWPSRGSIASDVVIGSDLRIAPGVLIGSGCKIGNRVSIGPNTVLANTLVEDDVSIGANCSVGLPGYGYERDEAGTPVRFPHLGTVSIARNVEIGSNVCIDRGALGVTMIGENCKIDNLVHIAHNVTMENGCMVIANSMIAGSVLLGERSWIAPSASILNQIHVGAEAVVGLGAVVIRSVAPGTTVVGNPARELKRSGAS